MYLTLHILFPNHPTPPINHSITPLSTSHPAVALNRDIQAAHQTCMVLLMLMASRKPMLHGISLSSPFSIPEWVEISSIVGHKLALLRLMGCQIDHCDNAGCKQMEPAHASMLSFSGPEHIHALIRPHPMHPCTCNYHADSSFCSISSQPTYTSPTRAMIPARCPLYDPLHPLSIKPASLSQPLLPSPTHTCIHWLMFSMAYFCAGWAILINNISISHYKQPTNIAKEMYSAISR